MVRYWSIHDSQTLISSASRLRVVASTLQLSMESRNQRNSEVRVSFVILHLKASSLNRHIGYVDSGVDIAYSLNLSSDIDVICPIKDPNPNEQVG
jgi:hypothetical protein